MAGRGGKWSLLGTQTGMVPPELSHWRTKKETKKKFKKLWSVTVGGDMGDKTDNISLEKKQKQPGRKGELVFNW